jgi:hypothetical protein
LHQYDGFDMHITTATASQPESTEAQVMARVRRAGRGSVWCAERLVLGLPRNAIDQALGRLTSKEQLIRIAHGIYLYPQVHPLLGMQPALLADVLQMYSDIGVGPLIPTGATAAAFFDLCEPEQMVIHYGGVGITRTIATARWTLYIRPVAARAIDGLHPLTAILIQAMRHIGQKHWNSTHTQLLRHRITGTSAAIICDQGALCPAWMRPIITTLRMHPSTAASTM